LPDPDIWLDAATRGTVLHDVYAEYYRILRDRGWKPDLERDGRQLSELLEVQLDRVREVLPAPSSAVERAEISALERDLEYFLKLELKSPERNPIALEVPFGLREESAEPLGRSQPVVLDLGPELQLPLRGRIDRIDRVPGGYAIVDYKTGRQLFVGRGATYDRGRLLQHALYAVAAEQLLDGPVIQSSYYFPTTGAAKSWMHFEYPDKTRLARVLSGVLEPLRTGAFVHTHKTDGDCRFCDFRAACGSHRDEYTKAKLENLANHLLAPRRELLEES
jgi:ATP-dependent helicase/nuclease subunit B